MPFMGGSRILLRRGAPLKNGIAELLFFFCRIPVVLESYMSSLAGGGGEYTPSAPFLGSTHVFALYLFEVTNLRGTEVGLQPYPPCSPCNKDYVTGSFKS